MVENLRHWKDNCNALGYDSDGEQLSQTGASGSEDDEEIARRKIEASFPKAEEHGGKGKDGLLGWIEGWDTSRGCAGQHDDGRGTGTAE